MKTDIKLFFAVLGCLVLGALSLVPGNLWMPFASDLPAWFTDEPLVFQVARLGPLIMISAVITGGLILVRRWWG